MGWKRYVKKGRKIVDRLEKKVDTKDLLKIPLAIGAVGAVVATGGAILAPAAKLYSTFGGQEYGQYAGPVGQGLESGAIVSGPEGVRYGSSGYGVDGAGNVRPLSDSRYGNPSPATGYPSAGVLWGVALGVGVLVLLLFLL